MIRTTIRICCVIGFALLCLGLTRVGGDSPGGPASGTFDLSWYTVDGGGDTFATGGVFSLGGTIGQYDAGGRQTGGAFALTGGFWTPN